MQWRNTDPRKHLPDGARFWIFQTEVADDHLIHKSGWGRVTNEGVLMATFTFPGWDAISTPIEEWPENWSWSAYQDR